MQYAAAKAMENEPTVGSSGMVLPTEMVEIEAIKEPLFKKPRTTLQVIDTFEKGKIMCIQPQERTLAPPNGWMTRDDFREKFTFKVQPPESSVLHLQDITLNTEMKLQVKQPRQMVWTDVVYTSDLYRTHHRSTTGPIRTQPDDAEGNARITSYTTTLLDNIFINSVDSFCASGVLFSDVSDHLPVFTFLSEKMNVEDKKTWITYREKSAINMVRFRTELQQRSWEI